VGAIGFFALEIFHSTEFLISLNLAILAIGLSLSSVGAQNVIILSVPRQNSGMSLGMTTFLRILGSSIAPAVAGMLMQQYQYTVNIGGITQSFPSSEAYALIFLIAAILSIVSLSLAVVLFKTRPPKCQNHLPEEEGEMDTTITENKKKRFSLGQASHLTHIILVALSFASIKEIWASSMAKSSLIYHFLSRSERIS